MTLSNAGHNVRMGEPFRTISLIDGRVTEYKGLANIPHGVYNLSDDGREIVYATREFQGRISVIENPYIK